LADESVKVTANGKDFQATTDSSGNLYVYLTADSQTVIVKSSDTTLAYKSDKNVVSAIEVIDKTALLSAITDATTAKTDILIDTVETNVAIGTKWVTESEMTAFTDAIKAAQTVCDNSEATKDEVDAAVSTLKTAVDTFNLALKAGTKVVKTALLSAITDATTAKTGVLVNTVATNVAIGTNWVTQSEMTALTDAIKAAQTVCDNSEATKDEVDTAVSILNTAKDTFNSALKAGAKVVVDKTALLNAITDATTTKTGVVVNTVASNVYQGTKWVTQDVMTNFTSAIALVQSVYTNDEATDVDVSSAINILTLAKSTFIKALQDGSKEIINKTALSNAITAATSAKTGIIIDTDSDNVSAGTKWVTAGVMADFTKVITLAQKIYANSDVSQSSVDTMVSTLTAETATFLAAVKVGTFTVDKSQLLSLITAATSSKNGISVSTSAAYVYSGNKWVTVGEMASLNNVISIAQAVYDNSKATQDEVDNAAGKIRSVQTMITLAIKYGTNEADGAVDKTDLLNAITAANLAGVDVFTDTAAGGVCEASNWVTAEEMAALNSAILIAQKVYNTSNSTEDAVNTAISTLNTAVETFNTALKVGTGTATKLDLEVAMGKADAASAFVVIGTKASNVSKDNKWVLSAEMKAYEAAITAATTVDTTTAATEQQIVAAIKALHAAKVTFLPLKKDGTHTDSSSGGSSSGGSSSGGSSSGGSSSGGSSSGGSSSGGSSSGGSSIGGSTSGSTTGTGTTTQTSASTLSDISGHWAYNAIVAMQTKGVVSGTPDGKFEPDKTATRAEFAKMAAVAFGYTSSGTTTNFSDVSSSDWFSKYVGALSEKNIISGVTDSSFSPNGSLTREQLATIIYRILVNKHATLSSASATTKFADGNSISSWAKDAVYTLQSTGIISGKGNNQFDPAGYATKAEVASILQRALALIG